MKCIVGLSGGVDSATAAAILKERGCEVIACTLKMFDSDQTDFSISEAEKIASLLNIKHEIVDCVSSFKKYVKDYFVDSYKSGLTPNPCIICNENVKFKHLNEFREEHNAHLIATGHYARLKKSGASIELHQANDQSKDQSYFLYRLDRNILMHTEFPLGEYTKSNTREMAKRFGIHVAEKDESQDICFLQNKDYVSFLRENLKKEAPLCCKKGHITDKSGKILGIHNGIICYTIGQRKGLGLSGGPFFVCGLNAEKNTVVVSDVDGVKSDKISLSNLKFINEEFFGDCYIKTRSASRKIHAKISKNLDNYIVELYEPEFGVADGQHCVFFVDGCVLGGGIINNSGISDNFFTQ